MIGLDTNILVRYLVQDDAKQAALAEQLIDSLNAQERRGFISLVVLAELVWVLESRFEFDRADVRSIVQELLDSSDLLIESSDWVRQALRSCISKRVDFADCLIERIASHHGASVTYTFDRGAAQHAGMVLLKQR
jgi:predicted nucleic-acid-binding protein